MAVRRRSLIDWPRRGRALAQGALRAGLVARDRAVFCRYVLAKYDELLRAAEWGARQAGGDQAAVRERAGALLTQGALQALGGAAPAAPGGQSP